MNEKPLLCNCKEQQADKLYEYKASLKGGRHTAFIAGRCINCGGWIVFPDFNFNLALSEGTEKTYKFLKDCGFFDKPITKKKSQKILDWIKTKIWKR